MKKVWLIGSMCFVALMVVIGGLTRLTESGLSMVDWRLFMGTIPPITSEAWLQVFKDYQAYPEYQQINSNMTLSEFKVIFLWEYAHRILGRLTGLWFLLGTGLLWFKSQFNSREKMAAIVACLAVMGQGLLGWYMVKSGLDMQPTVSHLRLAAHLSMAFLLFGFMWLWFLQCTDTVKLSVRPVKKIVSIALLGLLFLQIVYGAFMAGLDAGHLYATYPKMGSEWAPASIWLHKGLLKNLFYNPFMIHFVHRWLAILLLIVIFVWGHINRAHLLNSPLMIRFVIFLGLIIVQVLIGIGVIVMHVPILLAASHQMLGLFIWAAAIYLLSPFIKLSFIKKMS